MTQFVGFTTQFRFRQNRLDSIQIQLFKLLVAPKPYSLFNSTINISSQFSSQLDSALHTSLQINSNFRYLARWARCSFHNYLISLSCRVCHVCIQLEIELQPHCSQVWLVPTGIYVECKNVPTKRLTSSLCQVETLSLSVLLPQLACLLHHKTPSTN